MQAAKDTSTERSSKKEQLTGTRDVTASGLVKESKRARSPHSNKGSKPKMEAEMKEDSSKSIKLSEISEEVTLCKVVAARLNEYKDVNDRFNAIIRIIADPDF